MTMVTRGGGHHVTYRARNRAESDTRKRAKYARPMESSERVAKSDARRRQKGWRQKHLGARRGVTQLICSSRGFKGLSS